MPKVVIAGGSGFLGEILTSHFANQEYKVTIVSRSKPTFKRNFDWLQWDGKTLGDWVNSLDGANILINLSGKSVNCRYTQKNKDLLVSSRIASTKILGEALQKIAVPPKVWINPSSATIFANNGVQSGENEKQGIGFSQDLCRNWEKTLFESNTPKVRKIALRMGLVLDEKGELMIYFGNIIKTYFGGAMGGGKQHVSWLHYKDLIGIIDFIIDNEIEGPINAVSPTPTPNKDFMKAFRKQMKFPIGIPTATWMVKLGAAIVGTEPELVLYDRQIIPERLLKEGFKFKYNTIEDALKDLV